MTNAPGDEGLADHRHQLHPDVQAAEERRRAPRTPRNSSSWAYANGDAAGQGAGLRAAAGRAGEAGRGVLGRELQVLILASDAPRRAPARGARVRFAAALPHPRVTALPRRPHERHRPPRRDRRRPRRRATPAPTARFRWLVDRRRRVRAGVAGRAPRCRCCGAAARRSQTFGLELPVVRRLGSGAARSSARWCRSTAPSSPRSIAMLIAVPVSFGIAMFLTEIAPKWLRGPVGAAIELLAGIPSIIYGMWGLFVLVPVLTEHVYPWVDEQHRARWPLVGALFPGPPLGLGMLHRRPRAGDHGDPVHLLGDARGVPDRAEPPEGIGLRAGLDHAGKWSGTSCCPTRARR